MDAYLQVKRILFKDFKEFAVDLTRRIKERALPMAEIAGRTFRYLPSCNTRKETLARELIAQDQRTVKKCRLSRCLGSMAGWAR